MCKLSTSASYVRNMSAESYVMFCMYVSQWHAFIKRDKLHIRAIILSCFDVCVLRCRLFAKQRSVIEKEYAQVSVISVYNIITVYTATCTFAMYRKYQNLWRNNKVSGDKNAIYLHFLPYLLNICRQLEFLIS